MNKNILQYPLTNEKLNFILDEVVETTLSGFKNIKKSYSINYPKPPKYIDCLPDGQQILLWKRELAKSVKLLQDVSSNIHEMLQKMGKVMSETTEVCIPNTDVKSTQYDSMFGTNFCGALDNNAKKSFNGYSNDKILVEILFANAAIKDIKKVPKKSVSKMRKGYTINKEPKNEASTNSTSGTPDLEKYKNIGCSEISQKMEEVMSETTEISSPKTTSTDMKSTQYNSFYSPDFFIASDGIAKRSLNNDSNDKILAENIFVKSIAEERKKIPTKSVSKMEKGVKTSCSCSSFTKPKEHKTQVLSDKTLINSSYYNTSGISLNDPPSDNIFVETLFSKERKQVGPNSSTCSSTSYTINKEPTNEDLSARKIINLPYYTSNTSRSTDKSITSLEEKHISKKSLKRSEKLYTIPEVNKKCECGGLNISPSDKILSERSFVKSTAKENKKDPTKSVSQERFYQISPTKECLDEASSDNSPSLTLKSIDKSITSLEDQQIFSKSQKGSSVKLYRNFGKNQKCECCGISINASPSDEFFIEKLVAKTTEKDINKVPTESASKMGLEVKPSCSTTTYTIYKKPKNELIAAKELVISPSLTARSIDESIKNIERNQSKKSPERSAANICSCREKNQKNKYTTISRNASSSDKMCRNTLNDKIDRISYRERFKYGDKELFGKHVNLPSLTSRSVDKSIGRIEKNDSKKSSKRSAENIWTCQAKNKKSEYSRISHNASSSVMLRNSSSDNNIDRISYREAAQNNRKSNVYRSERPKYGDKKFPRQIVNSPSITSRSIDKSITRIKHIQYKTSPKRSAENICTYQAKNKKSEYTRISRNDSSSVKMLRNSSSDNTDRISYRESVHNKGKLNSYRSERPKYGDKKFPRKILNSPSLTSRSIDKSITRTSTKRSAINICTCQAKNKKSEYDTKCRNASSSDKMLRHSSSDNISYRKKSQISGKLYANPSRSSAGKDINKTSTTRAAISVAQPPNSYTLRERPKYEDKIMPENVDNSIFLTSSPNLEKKQQPEKSSKRLTEHFYAIPEKHIESEFKDKAKQSPMLPSARNTILKLTVQSSQIPILKPCVRNRETSFILHKNHPIADKIFHHICHCCRNNLFIEKISP